MILFKKCAVAFSFCFLTITIIWKRLVAITHNICIYAPFATEKLNLKALKHAKLTASKIAEYNPEEGKAILEELEKI